MAQEVRSVCGKAAYLAGVLLAALPLSARQPQAGPSDNGPRVLRGHQGAVLSASFSADGRRVLSCGRDDTARLWDAGTGKELAVFRCPPREGSFPYPAGLALALLSPDGRRVLTVSSSASSQAALDAWPGSASAGGGAVSFPGNAARLWDVGTGKALAEWKPDVADQFIGVGPFNATFSPDGRRVATTFGTYPDCSVRVHETAQGKELLRLKGHRFPVIAVAFSPDGKLLATASLDETVRLWDADKGDLVRALKGHTCDVIGVGFSPDGKQLLTHGAGYNHTFEVGPGRSASGSDSGTATMEDTLARVWDVGTGQEISALRWGGGNKGFVRVAQFSPNGRVILTAGKVGNSSGWRSRDAALWDAVTGKRLRGFKAEAADNVLAAALSPDAAKVAVAGREGTVRVLDAATGKELGKLRGHEKAVHSVVFSPDGKRLLTASEDGTARLWDTPGGH
jgi:WD40 repeat protein